ncbi:MAG: glucokinase [Halioglobus sp.]
MMKTVGHNTLNTRLVADVGGTNTRIALYDPQTDEFRALKTYQNQEYHRFEQVIDTWLGTLTEGQPNQACIAVAAAPSEDQVTMLNMDWSFSCSGIAQQFGFSKFHWINDFTAVAHALPYLGASQRLVLHAGAATSCSRFAAVGPGTGLGGATIESIDGKHYATACEPGHMGLSPATRFEMELFELLLGRYTSIYAELLTSGPGLQRLYEAICELRALEVVIRSPAEVAAAALSGADAQCVLALEMFSSLLGSACGDFLLANGAYGGLYLAGGIIPKMVPFLRSSHFHQRLCEKGGMQAHLEKVPVYIITAAQPGLIGASHVPL